MQLAAGRVEGTLLLVRAIVDGRAAQFVDGLPEEPLGGELAERPIVMEVADDLAAEAPEVVHVAADRFRREAGGG